ncbi:Six-bladed beta-propeller [Trema orientale]|uniref:Six-bladed beta-propeller n=1 Tax=Trema orientale TaxID=63057 RepID=A0A2P5CIC1_TREOI|nr:Six-bladed beta-propeller [Trema orientale]
MALRFRRLRETSRLLTLSFSGNDYKKCRPAQNWWALSRVPRSHVLDKISRRILPTEFHFQRFSSASKLPKKSTLEFDIVSFIKSCLNQHEGPNHCWLNKSEGTNNFSKRNGTFLVIAGQFSESSLTNSFETVIFFEKVKLLQQRFPQLHIIGFQSGSLICSAAKRSNLVQLIVKENITFPILLSNKNFSEVGNGACCILFKDFRNPVFHHENGLDFGVLHKAVEELHLQHNGKSKAPNNFKDTGSKQDEIIIEPNLCSMQNFLFYFPGCISADESGNRLFVSDSNHHRIIIFNGNGKILDCIGCSPGFEDGEFESSKLTRPAASFYHDAEDCLYLVDSENHAIRRADLGRRVLETLSPASNANKKSYQFWTWIKDKLRLRSNANTEPEAHDTETLVFPWHLIKSADDNLLVINRSFETLWMVNLASGEIEEVIKGFSNILEICREQYLEKVSLLKQMPVDWLQQQACAACASEELPYAGLISSLTTFRNQIVISDMVGQSVVKLSEDSKVFSNIQFSNIGILGLPYWLSPRLERAYAISGGCQGTEIDHLQCFSLLPGKVNVQLNVSFPVDTELVEPLQDGCIWCQARGVATIVSEEESEKVGSAQKWYDELDTLVFTSPESEAGDEHEDTVSGIKFQNDKFQINTAVNTSPGTSEVIINAALYLKLRRQLDQPDDHQEKYAARIVDLLSSRRSGKMERDACIQFLLKSSMDLRELIFMKPLQVRIKLDSFDHPKADNGRDIIFTESSIEVNVSLNS